jgi:hypothetical protein
MRLSALCAPKFTMKPNGCLSSYQIVVTLFVIPASRNALTVSERSKKDEMRTSNSSNLVIRRALRSAPTK